MLRRSLVAAALAALVLPAGAEPAGSTELMPGVTYSREVRFGSAGPYVLHVLVAPQPGGLYALRPVLSNNMVAGRETVSSMQRRLSRGATVAGVNGDLFNWTTGHPSGIFLRNGVLASHPLNRRSSLGIGDDGLLRVGRVGFRGVWRAPGSGSANLLREFNRPLPKTGGVALFTPSWDSSTPRGRRTLDVVLTGVSKAVPNTPLAGVVTRVRRSGGTAIPAGGAVLQARGEARVRLARLARPGEALSATLKLDPWWDGVPDAIGGGPALVRDARPIVRAREFFTSYQLFRRHPRTAVGQLPDGRIMFVAVDGRRAGSVGVRTSELALETARLGAVTAMALDAGGSTTMAFDGSVLNRPSEGAERAVSDALMLFYYGIYAPPARHRTFSPNGDGEADVQVVAAKLVRRSNVDLTLVMPNGEIAWQSSSVRDPGRFSKKLRDPLLAEGTWRWIVAAVDESGLRSEMTREFTVNNTLGFLRLSRERMRVRPRRGGRIAISFRLAHSAAVAVSIRNARGRVVRSLQSGRRLEPGSYAFAWNGKNAARRVVATGSYSARVRARNELGGVTLERRFFVRKLRRAR